jgi:hypothetical protein
MIHLSHNIRHIDAFANVSVHLKKPSGGPKGLIGPPCHGVILKAVFMVGAVAEGFIFGTSAAAQGIMLGRLGF